MGNIDQIAHCSYFGQTVLMCNRRTHAAFVALVEQAEQVFVTYDTLDQIAVEVGQLEKVFVGPGAVRLHFVLGHEQTLFPDFFLLLVFEYDEIDLGAIGVDQKQ